MGAVLLGQMSKSPMRQMVYRTQCGRLAVSAKQNLVSFGQESRYKDVLRGRSGDNALLALVIMCHGNDYISLFVSFFDVPVRLDNLLQRIPPVNGRFQLFRFNKLFEED